MEDGSSFIRKFDNSGNDVWKRLLDPTSNFALDAVRGVDADGNVYVAGDVGAALPNQTVTTENDGFLRKYDSAGNEIWTRQFGTSARDSAAGVAVDATGVYVAGSTGGALPGQSSGGDFDAFVR